MNKTYIWRKLHEQDKKRKKILARSKFEDNNFYITWNEEWSCWGLYNAKHILVHVSEVFAKPIKE